MVSRPLFVRRLLVSLVVVGLGAGGFAADAMAKKQSGEKVLPPDATPLG